MSAGGFASSEEQTVAVSHRDAARRLATLRTTASLLAARSLCARPLHARKLFRTHPRMLLVVHRINYFICVLCIADISY
jgi:hypothetical protein